MDEEEILLTDNYDKIPHIFYNNKTQKPHTVCYYCNKYLLKAGTLYVIEKAFQAHYSTMDYALCIDCYDYMFKDIYSVESMQKLEKYIDERFDPDLRGKTYPKKYGVELNKWLEYCVFTGKKIVDCEEYQIAGQCDGPHMVYHTMPFAMSNEAMEEIYKILSKQTKDNIDEFMDQFNEDPKIKLPLPKEILTLK